MRISDWSSDVCSSDLEVAVQVVRLVPVVPEGRQAGSDRHQPDVAVEGVGRRDDLRRGDVERAQLALEAVDRKSVVSGKSVSVRVDLGGRLIIKKKTKRQTSV